MDTSKLKKFAPAIRIQLMEAVERKLDYVLTSDTPDLRQLSTQVTEIRKLEEQDRQGLIEQVAYTWFNRFAALRFLDAHDWHPFKSRILTAATPEETQPEILKLLRTGNLPEDLEQYADLERLDNILEGKIPSPHPQREVYRDLILASCRFYHSLMPYLFEKIDDPTELLLPDDLLTATSVLEGFRTEITDEDCEEVEIIGWLYQFYISDKKDTVMARKKAVPKEDIPSVTQLFTPHWIVRYMVENSLGRLWMQNRPESKLLERMDYYIADAEGQEDTDFLRFQSVEEIKLIDPACGSGHILTYAFDLLHAMYEEEGYEPSSIPGHILSKNLHGVEIDERAAELSYFALMMKAQQHYSRFLRRQLRIREGKTTGGQLAEPNICCLQDIHFEEGELKSYMDGLSIGELFNEQVLRLMYQFEDAKNLGSLIQPCIDDLSFLRDAISSSNVENELFLRETHRKVETVLKQAEYLNKKYHCAVLNPPYMNKFNGVMKSFIETNFKDFKADLFAAFIIRSKAMTIESGLLGFMTPFVWMFISSYEKLRANVLNESTLTSLIQLEYSGFDGATVPICTFTVLNKHLQDYEGGFVRLSDFRGAKVQGPKALEIIQAARKAGK